MESDALFFGGQFATVALDPAMSVMFDSMASRLEFLSTDARQSFEKQLIATWAESLETFEKENVLADATRPLWPQLSEDTKKMLIRWFIGFLNSYRRPSFAQYRLARDVVTNKQNAALVNDVLCAVLKGEHDKLKVSEKDPDWRRDMLRISFDNLAKTLGETFDRALDSVAPAVGKAQPVA